MKLICMTCLFPSLIPGLNCHAAVAPGGLRCDYGENHLDIDARSKNKHLPHSRDEIDRVSSAPRRRLTHAVLRTSGVIAKLDEAGKAFEVLLINTTLTPPYTLVFFQLEYGYWHIDSETRLRAAMTVVI